MSPEVHLEFSLVRLADFLKNQAWPLTISVGWGDLPDLVHDGSTDLPHFTQDKNLI